MITDMTIMICECNVNWTDKCRDSMGINKNKHYNNKKEYKYYSQWKCHVYLVEKQIKDIVAYITYVKASGHRVFW